MGVLYATGKAYECSWNQTCQLYCLRIKQDCLLGKQGAQWDHVPHRPMQELRYRLYESTTQF
jgi:hypothetical protein